jgi:hypothetical protein
VLAQNQAQEARVLAEHTSVRDNPSAYFLRIERRPPMGGEQDAGKESEGSEVADIYILTHFYW